MRPTEATAAQAIPYPTDARQAALDAVIRYLEMLRSWTLTRRGVAGNGAGLVNVSDRTNFIYARLGDANGEAVEARNVTLLDIADNDPVLLARERPGALGGWLVVDWYGTGSPAFVTCDCRAQLTVCDWDGADVVYDAAVAVRGHFAYVMTPALQDGVTFSTNARLFTVDLATPSAPTIVDTQDVGETWRFVNVRVASDASKLWVSGALYDDPDTPNGTYRAARYDLTTPDAPTLDAVDDFPLTETWGLFEQGGDFYLFGAYPVDLGGGNNEYRYAVVNGDTFATEGTYDPNDVGGGIYISADPFTHGEPLQIDDHVTLRIPVTDTTHAVIGLLDLADVTAPALAWQDDDDTDVAVCKISDTEFYGLYARYDATTPASTTKDALTGTGFDAVTGYYNVISANLILEATLASVGGGNFDNASTFRVYSIASPLAPAQVRESGCGDAVYNTGIQKFGDSDVESGTAYACGVGATAGGIVLTVAAVEL